MTGIDWDLVKTGCPRCGKSISYHSLTGWCNHCSWGINWSDWGGSRPNAKRILKLG